MTFRPLSALRRWVRYAWFTLDSLARRGEAQRKPLFPKAQLVFDPYNPRESFNSIGGTMQMALVGGGITCLAQNLLRKSAPAAEVTVVSTTAPSGTFDGLSRGDTPSGSGGGGDVGDRRGPPAPSDLSYSSLSDSALAYLEAGNSGSDNSAGGTLGTAPNAVLPHRKMLPSGFSNSSAVDAMDMTSAIGSSLGVRGYLYQTF